MPPTVGVPEPRETKEGHHVHEPLTESDLHRYLRVAIARIPLVVPCAVFDNGSLALMQNARLSVALHGQVTFEHGDLLDQSGMAMFS